MIKNKLRYVTALLFVCATTVIAGGVSLNKSIAKAGTDTTTQTAKISVVDGAQVKYMNDNTDSGMRFNFTLTTAAYNAAYGANASGVEVGVLLVPADLLNGELKLESMTSNAKIHKEVFPQSEWVAETDGYSAYAYIYNFTVDAYKRDMTIVGYYTDNGVTEYTSVVTRSMTYVAAHAYNDDEETNKTALEKYLVDCTVTVDDKSTTYKAGDMATVTAEEMSDNQFFDGWYVNEEKVSDALSYTFIVDKDIQLVAGYKDPIDIATATLSVPNDLKHTGRSVEPTVTVKDDNKTLVKDIDYTVSYTGDTQNLKAGSNVNYGEATVVVTGIGKYTGTNSLDYKFYSKATAKRIDGDASDWADYNGNESVIEVSNGAKGVRTKAKMESDGIYVFATAKHATLVTNSGNPQADTALDVQLAFVGEKAVTSGVLGYKSAGGYFITANGNAKDWVTAYGDSNAHGNTESAFVTNGTEGAYTTNVEVFIPMEFLAGVHTELFDNGALADGVDIKIGFGWNSVIEKEKSYMWDYVYNSATWLPTNRWTGKGANKKANVESEYYYLDKYTTDSNAINRGLRMNAHVTQDFAIDGNGNDWANYEGHVATLSSANESYRGMDVKAKWGSDGVYVYATTRHTSLYINSEDVLQNTRLIIPFGLEDGTNWLAGDGTFNNNNNTATWVISITSTGDWHSAVSNGTSYWNNYPNGFTGVESAMRITESAGAYVTYTEVFIPTSHLLTIDKNKASNTFFNADGTIKDTTNLRISFAWHTVTAESTNKIGNSSTYWTPSGQWSDSLKSTSQLKTFFILDKYNAANNKGLQAK